MNKFNKKLVVLGLLAVAGLSGCANVNSSTKRDFNKNTSDGYIYGLGVSYLGSHSVDDLCNSIENKDSRCMSKEKYKTVVITTEIGSWVGAIGTTALVPTEMDIGKLYNGWGYSVKGYNFLKVKLEIGKLPTVEGVASYSGDNRCSWSGSSTSGGVVCVNPQWDYKNDGANIGKL